MSIADKLTTIAENMQNVYDAGYEKGKAEGGDNWEDTFWNVYQENGNRTDYAGAFSGIGWDNETFKPQYDIKPVGACNYSFGYSGLSGDLVEILKNLNVTLDLSKITSFHSGFSNAKNITRVGVVDIRNCGAACSSVFTYMSALVTIDELIISNTTPNTLFSSNPALENIKITGNICTTGWNFRTSTKLSKASITNIINALSTTTSGLSVTISKTAKEAVFTPDEWSALEATKPNWTISLS